MSSPSLDELLDSAHVVSIPTRTRFRGITEREAVIFEGPNGASEFSPFLEYGDAEASRWLAAAIEFGWADLPKLLRTTIAVNATVPAVTAAEVPGVLARFPGCTTAKVKVAEKGQSLRDDVDRVRAVREALGPDGLIRVDANMGWTVDEAFEALTALAPFGLDYAEQPCATVPELAELRQRLLTLNQWVPGSNPLSSATPRSDIRQDGFAGSNAAYAADLQSAPLVRIAADESVRKAEDPLAVARAGAADLIVVKVQPLGGIKPALRIIEEAGLPVIVSSALDTSVGISMGLHLAATLPDGLLAGACGLGTVALLEGDVAVDPLLPHNGELPVGRPTLNPETLSRYRAAPAREAWWFVRVERCFEQLAR